MVAIAVDEQNRGNVSRGRRGRGLRERRKPKLPASNGSAPAPLKIVRRVRFVLASLVIFSTLAVLQVPS